MAKTDDFDILQQDPEKRAKREKERKKKEDQRRWEARYERLRREAIAKKAREDAMKRKRKAAMVWLAIRGSICLILALCLFWAELHMMVTPKVGALLACMNFGYFAFWCGDLYRLYKEGAVSV